MDQSGGVSDPSRVSTPLAEWLTALAARTGVPGGGAACAVVLGVSAALMHMAAVYSADDDEIRMLEERLRAHVRTCEELSEADGRVSGALGAALADTEAADRDARVSAAARDATRSSAAIAELGVRLADELMLLHPRAAAAIRADVGVAAAALVAGIDGALINLRADARLAAHHAHGDSPLDQSVVDAAERARGHAATVVADIGARLSAE